MASPSSLILKMPSPKDKPILIVLVGPTAVGKTDLSIQLAKAVNGEIISADASLFYRGMNIGTAKPSKEKMASVPHHLINTANPDESWSLASFQEAAYTSIDDVVARGRQPILVGGTGQYVRSIVEGWTIPPQSPDQRLRKALTEWGEEISSQVLFDKLTVIDPQAAQQIDPFNLRRVVRALEVIFSTGEKFSTLRSKTDPRYDVRMIGLIRPREELYTRVDERIETMVSSGLIEEVKNLLTVYSPTTSAFNAIGYREVIQYLQNEITLEEAVTLMKRRTRQLIRRQTNWFKPTDPAIHWISPGTSALTEILAAVNVCHR